jgi:hypothetical protein
MADDEAETHLLELSFHWYSRKDAKVSSRSTMSVSNFGS